MTGHTPGPWRVGRSGAVVSDSPNGLPASFVSQEDHVAYYGGFLVGESITPANAHLIAAAPDLLAVLKRLEFCGAPGDEKCIVCHGWKTPSFGRSEPGHTNECALNAAIAKATTPGGSSPRGDLHPRDVQEYSL